MLAKMRRALNNQRGIAIIIVLSLGAVLIALSTALLYTASTLTASANQVLQREDVYRMARTFSDKLDAELTDTESPDSDFKDFVMHQFIGANAAEISASIYDPEGNGASFDFTYENTDYDFGADKIIVTLKKEDRDAEGDPKYINISSDDAPDAIEYTKSTESGIADDSFDNALSAFSFPADGSPFDYILTMTVTAEYDGVTAAFTRSYERRPSFAAHYIYSGNVCTSYESLKAAVNLAELPQGATVQAYYVYLDDGKASFVREGGGE